MNAHAAVACPSCRRDNRPGRHFCGGCGAALPVPCPRCGTTNEPGDAFCGRCGAPLATRSRAGDVPAELAEKILGSRAALEGERKHVTVLFVDVKGSMDLAERLDPEEWHAMMDRFFQLLAAGVHRFEGTVNQYTGDGIMALFGAPIAHEDHAQRACRAALDLRDRLRPWADELRTTRGLSFAVRMGLNSGEVVVGTIGDDLRMDYTAIGHTVGLARRMEELAEPGRPLLTEHTAKLVAGFFALRDLGPSRLKGASEPIRLYELEGAGTFRTRFDVSRARGLSRFVGRSAEMATLDAVLERALAGDGRLVGVVAEPGVGKSRLCHEFIERCRARGLGFVEAHAVAHGRTTPLLPWMELLRSYVGIGPTDRDDTARQKVAGRLVLLDAGLQDALPVVFEFLGIADPAHATPRAGPDALQREITRVFERMTAAWTRRGEIAGILLEDVHWFDPASEALLAALETAVARTPFLRVVSFRPGHRAPWMKSPAYEQLELRPLAGEPLGALLHHLLGDDPSVAPLATRLREITAGNPFFVEEAVQALVETGALVGTRGAYRLARGVERITIPATVHAVLAARIDRLPEEAKAVLHVAAVIGREVPDAILRRVSAVPDDVLARAVEVLLASEFLYEARADPEPEYAFRHPLTQEVAYRSQLGERRAQLHAAVARAVEALYPNKLAEWAALVAHHWERVPEPLTAARWHERAADWVARRDRRDMLRHWRRVRELLAAAPETEDTVALRVRACRYLLDSVPLGSGEDPAALFTEGMALAARLDDPAPRIRLLNVHANSLSFAGQVHEAHVHFQESLALADASGRPFLRFLARVPLTRALVLGGRLSEAVAVSELADELGRDCPELESEAGLSPLGLFLVQRGTALTYVGRVADGIQAIDRAIGIAHERGEVELEAFARLCRVLPCDVLGAHEQALTNARLAVELADTGGNPFVRGLALSALGGALVIDERWQEAIDALIEALAIAREQRVAAFAESDSNVFLAEARLGAGDPTGAASAAGTAIALARELGRPVAEARGHLARARVLLAAGGPTVPGEAAVALDEAAALLAATGAGAFKPFVHLAHAEHAARLGDDVARARELREAHAGFTAMGATERAARVAAVLATLPTA